MSSPNDTQGVAYSLLYDILEKCHHFEKKKVFFQANVIYKESSKRIILLEELVNFKCQYGIVCKDKVQL